MINLAKLDEAIAYIEAHPEEHDQGTWFRRRTEGEWCQTTACREVDRLRVLGHSYEEMDAIIRGGDRT